MTVFILTLITTLVHFLIKWKGRDTFQFSSIIAGGFSVHGLDVYTDNLVLFLLSLTFLFFNFVLLFTPDRAR